MLEISKVYKNSIASFLNLKKGDKILAFNGFEAVDVLDLIFYDGQTSFSITIDRDGEVFDLRVDKDEFEILGIELKSDNLKLLTCHNKCLFCFVDQMPKGLRESLYLKDDDYRQSFLRGNFVTLSNVNDKTIDRIIRLNLSPLYISVQVTDPETRIKLLNNRFAGDILKKLEKLTKNGIKVHTQVVLVPGVNDGAIFEKTCLELSALGENVLSIAVVPCGVTKFREGLFEINDIDKDYAKNLIETVRVLNKKFKKNLITPADEFYFKSGMTVEDYDFYGSFPQIENGVGVTAKFLNELNGSLKKAKNKKKFLVISGTSAYEFIKEQAKKVESYIDGCVIEVVKVENEFFGKTVNCTGLLVGQDILNAVKPYLSQKYDKLVLPCYCLKRDEEVFLDGLTLKSLKKQLKLKVAVTDGSGEAFFNAFL